MELKEIQVLQPVGGLIGQALPIASKEKALLNGLRVEHVTPEKKVEAPSALALAPIESVYAGFAAQCQQAFGRPVDGQRVKVEALGDKVSSKLTMEGLLRGANGAESEWGDDGVTDRRSLSMRTLGTERWASVRLVSLEVYNSLWGVGAIVSNCLGQWGEALRELREMAKEEEKRQRPIREEIRRVEKNKDIRSQEFIADQKLQ